MITVTRLNDKALVINAELIKTVESTPDTLITLLNGDHMIVKEPMEEIVRKAVEYGRQIRTFARFQCQQRGAGASRPGDVH